MSAATTPASGAALPSNNRREVELWCAGGAVALLLILGFAVADQWFRGVLAAVGGAVVSICIAVRTKSALVEYAAQKAVADAYKALALRNPGLVPYKTPLRRGSTGAVVYQYVRPGDSMTAISTSSVPSLATALDTLFVSGLASVQAIAESAAENELTKVLQATTPAEQAALNQAITGIGAFLAAKLSSQSAAAVANKIASELEGKFPGITPIITGLIPTL